MAADEIDPDKVAKLGQDMLSMSVALGPASTTVGNSELAGSLGRAGDGASITGTYSALTQGAVDAVDTLCSALETNAEYVSYAAQQGDDAFN